MIHFRNDVEYIKYVGMFSFGDIARYLGIETDTLYKILRRDPLKRSRRPRSFVNDLMIPFKAHLLAEEIRELEKQGFKFKRSKVCTVFGKIISKNLTDDFKHSFWKQVLDDARQYL